MEQVIVNVLNNVDFESSLKDVCLKAKKENEKVCVLYLDCDDFEQLTAVYPEEMLELFLKETEETLINNLPVGSVCSRYGNDEFAVFVPSIRDLEQVRELSSQLLSKLSSKVMVKGKETDVSFSFGVSMNGKWDTEISLLYKSSVAMNDAKKKGRNQFSIYGE